MLGVERRHQIVGFVEHNNGATVAALSARFGVSEATIRRDVLELSKRGLVERAHGGAAPRRERSGRQASEPPLQARIPLHEGEKCRIGERAAQHVQDGDAIILSGGTTTAAMIPFLAARRRLTVITNALNTGMLLASYPQITVILLGGTLRHAELTLHGALSEGALQDLRADRLFLSTLAIDVDYGFSADDLREAQSVRALMGAAREITMLADHTKFGKLALVRIAPVNRIQRIISDTALSADHVGALREQGVEVDLA